MDYNKDENNIFWKRLLYFYQIFLLLTIVMKIVISYWSINNSHEQLENIKQLEMQKNWNIKAKIIKQEKRIIQT